MKQVFFITGLPRSRTAWLANLFTYGPSFCWHDLTAQLDHIEELKSWIRNVSQDIVGVSDSGLGLFACEVLQQFPDAKWILVRRPRGEALVSFLQFYADRGLDDHETDLLLRRIDTALDALTASLGRDHVRTVDYGALEWMETARDLWQFICPMHPFNGARWEQLNALRINTIPEKVRASGLLAQRYASSLQPH